MLRVLAIILFTVSLAQAQLNSRYDEQNPVLSPDQTELYFTVANHPLNISGVRDKGDIWASRKENGVWTPAKRVNGLINNGGYNAVLGFSSDGNEMFLYGHYSANGDAAGSQKPPEFLSTHPSDENRIARIEGYMPEALGYYKPIGK